jgi:hypothetical protein
MILLKKLMRKRQTKNQVCVAYGVYAQSNGIESLPTVRDLRRSPTLEGAWKWIEATDTRNK